jgi:aspartokinase-like uncharacterized kinase
VSTNTTIVKVGGSAFRLPDWPERVATWLGKRPAAQHILIAGGGAVADEVRRLTAALRWDDVSTHWLAVKAMTFQSHVLAAGIRGTAVESSLEACRARLRSAPAVILDPYEILASDAGRSLPVGWHVTADSIAAFLAHRAGVSELVLLKCVGGQEPIRADDAVARGWVDPYFPTAAKDLRVLWVNLAEDRSTLFCWDANPAPAHFTESLVRHG